MGGNKERTKNNTRPANSNRSAAFVTGFSLLESPHFLRTNDDVYECAALEPNLQVVIKKLLKRNSVTKYKALSELSQLIESSEIESVKAILPLWPKLYTGLATDIDHRVRENCQQAHRTIVLKLGKHIAPILKQICPEWIASKYDSYGPAATIAVDSFTTAFPERKVREVLQFCQEEIVDFVVKGLTAAMVVPNDKNYTAAEYEGKFHRLLTGTLHSYAFYFENVGENALNRAERHQQLLRDSKFWSYGKHKTDMVRAAWYNCISLILQRAPALLGDHYQKAVSLTVQSLDDPDPVVQTAVWSCLLLIQTTVPNWIQYTNIEKAFLVKVRNVVKEPSLPIHEYLLPFISNINVQVLDSHAPRFFQEFFDGLLSAIKNVKSGQNTYIKSLVDTLFECLQFVLSQLMCTTSTTQTPLLLPSDANLFSSTFIRKYVLDLLSWAIREHRDKVSAAANRNVFTIVQYWSNHLDQYERQWKDFWLQLASMFEGMLIEPDVDPNIVIGQTDLLLYFRQPIASSTVDKRVHFGEVKPESTDSPRQESPEVNKWPELLDLCVVLCKRYFIELNDHKDLVYVKAIYRIVKIGDQRLVNMILQLTTFEELQARLMDWLQTNSMVAEETIDLLLLLGQSQNDTIQEQLLDGLLKVDNYQVKNWALTKTLDVSPEKALQSVSVTTYLEHCILRMHSGMDVIENVRVIEEYFQITSQAEPPSRHIVLINMICDNIVQSLHEGVDNSIISKLLTRIFVANSQNLSPELSLRIFDTIFAVNLNSQGDFEFCMEAAKKCSIILDDSTVSYHCSQVHDHLRQHVDYRTISVETYIKAYSSLVKPPFTENQLAPLFEFSIDKELEYLQRMALTILHIKDRICIASTPVNVEHNVDLIKCLKVAQIKAGLVQYLFSQPNHGIARDFISSVLRDLTLIQTCAVLMTEFACENSETDALMQDSSEYIVKALSSSTEISEYVVTLLHESEITTDLWATARMTMNCELENVMDTPNVAIRANKLKQMLPKLPPKSLQIQLDDVANESNLVVKTVYINSLMENHFNASYNNPSERDIIVEALRNLDIIITQTKAKELNLLYNAEVKLINDENLALVCEVSRLLKLLILFCPDEITTTQWDFLRIALSSWILTVSKVMGSRHSNPKVAQLILVVCRLFGTLMTYFDSESKKSSTQKLVKVMEEWSSIFAREVNLVSMKIIYNLLSSEDVMDKYILAEAEPLIMAINYNYIFMRNQQLDKGVGKNELLQVILKNLSHPVHRIRHSMFNVLLKIIPLIVESDTEALATRDPTTDKITDHWHFMQTTIEGVLHSAPVSMNEFVANFQFKEQENGTDVENSSADRENIIAYLFLWKVILGLCAQAGPELRSIYAQWITRHGNEQILLLTLFKLLPNVLRNFESRSPLMEARFQNINHLDISDRHLNIERLVCSTYLDTVRTLPAVIRKCWTNLPHRSNLIVERFTSYYVSPIICHEELQALLEKRDKLDKFQISVHNSTREILAVYAIDEARMELIITLPPNFPLNVAKVAGGKQIGNRIQSKTVLMQLNLFLSHQNGTIWNGLSIWKRNLDKKFEGVEECYVCYSVIHQDTYQLPKLSCKTCRKKFHSPCLYRWFSTSNKSTCPICRNIF